MVDGALLGVQDTNWEQMVAVSLIYEPEKRMLQEQMFKERDMPTTEGKGT